MCDEIARVRETCEMNYGIAAPHNIKNCIEVAQVSLDVSEVAMGGAAVRQRRCDIDSNDLVAMTKGARDGWTTDATIAACDEYLHVTVIRENAGGLINSYSGGIAFYTP